MHTVTWIEPYYDLILNEIPKDVKDVLEVGCGSGILGFIIKQTRQCKVLGIEPFDYDLGHYDSCYRGTWQEWINSECVFSPSYRYGCIVSTECIEHMEKKDALVFLQEAKKIAEKVVIATPYKFDHQPAYDNNPHQVHKSLITVKDFQSLGYQVKFVSSDRNLSYGFRRYGRYHRIAGLLYNITNLVGIYES